MRTSSWVPALPSGWQKSSLRRVGRIFAGGTPDRKNEAYWTNGEIPWLNSGAVNQGTITKPSSYVTTAAARNGSTRWVNKNSVLIALAGQGKTKGLSARTSFRTTFNQSLAAIEPTSSIEFRFLHYWLQCNYQNIRGLSGGDLRDGLNLEHIGSIELPHPPRMIQERIADYLDHETAEIDAFVEEQLTAQRLLRERRSAVITRAVTKGLDPRAQLVESDDEAIGTYPAHWRLLRVKHLGDSIIGLTYSPEDIVESADDGTLVVRAGNIRDGRLQQKDPIYVSSNIPEKLRLRCGDIIICARNGSANLVGKNAPVSDEFLGSTWGAFMVVVRSTYPKYLRWFLNSEVFSAQTGSFTTTTINQLTSSSLGNLVVALPPSSEQKSIDTHLRKQTARIDEMSYDLRSLIDLARERRAALITAAVTGQIDVTAKNKPAAEQLEDDIAQGLHKESQ